MNSAGSSERVPPGGSSHQSSQHLGLRQAAGAAPLWRHSPTAAQFAQGCFLAKLIFLARNGLPRAGLLLFLAHLPLPSPPPSPHLHAHQHRAHQHRAHQHHEPLSVHRTPPQHPSNTVHCMLTAQYMPHTPCELLSRAVATPESTEHVAGSTSPVLHQTSSNSSPSTLSSRQASHTWTTPGDSISRRATPVPHMEIQSPGGPHLYHTWRFNLQAGYTWTTH